MQSSYTPRFNLPLLAIGQAQKELYHNEALVLLDFLVNPTAIAIHEDPSLLSPSEGDAWLVGSSPIGEWNSKSSQIAVWTAGGWRFVVPGIGTKIYLLDTNEIAIFRNGDWVLSGQISAPNGGAFVDVEARLAIDSLLTALKDKALIEN